MESHVLTFTDQRVDSHAPTDCFPAVRWALTIASALRWDLFADFLRFMTLFSHCRPRRTASYSGSMREIVFLQTEQKRSKNKT